MWKSRPYNKNIELDLLGHKVNPLLSRLLSQRNIDYATFQEVFKSENFVIENSFRIKDIDVAAELVKSLFERENKIKVSVIGDYDVDGIISSYMIRRFCDIFNIECRVFLPSRFEHGYGLNSKTIEHFVSNITDAIPDILFVVDCGSSSEREISILKKAGIKYIIVLDHHVINKDTFSKSADYVLNWRLGDGKAYEMCSAGMVYALLKNIEVKSDGFTSKEFIPLAAIATIADMSPIWKDNRKIVKNGLVSFTTVRSSGLKILANNCGLKDDMISQSNISFKLAPKLNAVGRLESPQKAFDLLHTDDFLEIQDIVDHLGNTNKERQDIQFGITQEAMLMVKEDEMTHGIFLINNKWNIGVVGIVASEIVEKYHRPVIVVGEEGGVLKGSGRSVKDINLKRILDNCSEMFEKYGGHEMAAGVTLKKEFVHKAHIIFDLACKNEFEGLSKNVEQTNFYDAKISPKTISKETWDLLNILYPYCEVNNPEPVFILENVRVKKYNKKETEKWRLSMFFVEDVMFKFTSFSNSLDDGIQNKRINVFFKFPQIIDSKWGMSLDVVDVEILNEQ